MTDDQVAQFLGQEFANAAMLTAISYLHCELRIPLPLTNEQMVQLERALKAELAKAIEHALDSARAAGERPAPPTDHQFIVAETFLAEAEACGKRAAAMAFGN